MADYYPSQPEKEQIALELPGPGITLTNFTEYEFDSNFLQPTDGFSFTVAAERVTDKVRLAISPGSLVRLTLNGKVQATGYIDTLEVVGNRESGGEFKISGRDKLGPAVSACADPTKEFVPGTTLGDALEQLFAPYGWAGDGAFDISNDANRDLESGSVFGKRVTKKGRDWKKDVLHQQKPYPNEGLFAFASRMATRQGLMIWPSADGATLIVGRPDFDTDPLYKILRNVEGTTNVLDGSVRFDTSDQPTMVVADGFSGGNDYGHSGIVAYMRNNAVFTDDPAFLAQPKSWPDAREVVGHAFTNPIYVPRHVLVTKHDSQAQTLAELENFLRREVSLLQRKSLTAHYTVEGHGQNTPAGFAVWAVDTTVDVVDDLAGLNERLWVLGRTFLKSRQGGTSTRLELIRRYSIQIGDDSTDNDATTAGTPAAADAGEF